MRLIIHLSVHPVQYYRRLQNGVPIQHSAVPSLFSVGEATSLREGLAGQREPTQSGKKQDE